MPAFEVGQSDNPVFRDGLTSDLSYVFLACKNSDQYNGVVFGRSGKLKFYPNACFWGLTEENLKDLGLSYVYNRNHYQGVANVSRSIVVALLERLRTQRGTACVSDKEFMALDFYAGQGENKARSRSVHPHTHAIPDALDLSALAA